MTDKNDKIKAGQEAQTILDNPLVVGAFNQILNDGYQQWISTKPEDKETRENLYFLQINALKFKQILINTVDSGKIAEQEVKEGKNG